MKKKAAAKRPTKAVAKKKLVTKAAAKKKPLTKAVSTKKKVTQQAAAKSAVGKGTAKRPAAKRTTTIVKASGAGTYIKFGNPVYTVLYGSQITVSAGIRRTINDLPVIQVPLSLSVSDRDYARVNSDTSGHARWTIRTNNELEPRDHSIVVRFGGNSTFSGSTGRAKLTVYIASSRLQAQTTSKPGGRFELRGILKGVAGEPVVDRRVKFLVNGSQKGTAKTDGAGIARYDYRPSAPGNKLTVEFDGDRFYKASKSNTTF